MFRNICPLAIALAVATMVPAQADPPYFRLDFEDGVLPSELEPSSNGCGDCTIEDGSLIMRRPGSYITGAFVWFEPDDFIVNTQIRFLDDVGKDDFAAILVRDAVPNDGVAPSYYAGLTTSGEIIIQRITPGQGYPGVGLDPNAVVRLRDAGLDPINQDVHLQFLVDGSTLSLSAWEDGRPMPTAPQLVLVDDQYPENRYVGIYNSSFARPPGASIAFRFLETLPLTPTAPGLQPGDADQDFEFDQQDVVTVLVANKYLTGQPATWGEGDWDGAPGGSVGNPPAGDGRFDTLDIVAALGSGVYLTGPYSTVLPAGQRGDGQTSIVYDARSGELAVDAPSGVELTSINMDSAAGIFTGDAAQNLGGSFDNDADGNVFKATFGSSFGSLSFGNIAQAGLSEAFLLEDMTIVGSLAGGGGLGEVDLVYLPEPASVLLLSIGLVLGLLIDVPIRRRCLVEPAGRSRK